MGKIYMDEINIWIKKIKKFLKIFAVHAWYMCGSGSLNKQLDVNFFKYIYFLLEW